MWVPTASFPVDFSFTFGKRQETRLREETTKPTLVGNWTRAPCQTCLHLQLQQGANFVPQCPANTPFLMHKPPCIFSAKSCWDIFIPRISPPPPLTQKKTHPAVEILRLFVFKPLGCLRLKCLLQTQTARINDGHSSYFAKCPASSPSQHWSSSAYW